MQQSGEVTFPTLVPPTSTSNGPPSTPTSRSTTGFKTLPLHQSNCFKCTDTRFVTDITPNNPVSGRTWLQRRGGLFPRPTYWKASPAPQKRPGSSSKDLDKRLSHMTRHYSLVDPPPKREKAIPPWAGHIHRGIGGLLTQGPMHGRLDSDMSFLLSLVL